GSGGRRCRGRNRASGSAARRRKTCGCPWSVVMSGFAFNVRRTALRMKVGRRCETDLEELLTPVHLPHLHRPVLARAGETLAVRAEAHAVDSVDVALEGVGESLPLAEEEGALVSRGVSVSLDGDECLPRIRF